MLGKYLEEFEYFAFVFLQYIVLFYLFFKAFPLVVFFWCHIIFKFSLISFDIFW